MKIISVRELDLTCPFFVRFIDYGHEDVGGEFEEDIKLNLLLRKYESIVDENQAIEEFNKWCLVNSNRNFKLKPILYREQVICKMN